MAQIYRLEDAENRDVGGVLIAYPSGYRQQLSWHWLEGMALAGMGQELAGRALAGLMDGRRPGWEADVRETNWVSLSAGLDRVVRDWASKRGVEAPGESPQVEVGVTPS